MIDLKKYRETCLNDNLNQQSLDELAEEFLKKIIEPLFLTAIKNDPLNKSWILILKSKGVALADFYDVQFFGDVNHEIIRIPQKYNIPVISRSIELFEKSQKNSKCFIEVETDTFLKKHIDRLEYTLNF